MFILAVAGFGVWMGVQVLAGWFIELMTLLWEIRFGGAQSSKMVLNYFVRDLIRLHVPARIAVESGGEARADDSKPAVAPLVPVDIQVDGVAIAALKSEAEACLVERV